MSTNIDTNKIPQLDRIEMMLQLFLKYYCMPRLESRWTKESSPFNSEPALSAYEQDLLSSLIHTEHYGT